MSNKILIKRSGTANSVPVAGDLSLGELAINYNDGNLFYKDTGGTVRTLVSTQFVSVAGNVTGGNLVTAGALSAASVSASGTVTSASVVGGVITGTSVSVTGNVTGGNLVTAAAVSAASVVATGNVTGGNINTGGLVSVTGNVTAAGNVSGNYILGNGALLTGVITSVANINLGNSNVTVVSSGGNVTVGVGGTSNVAVFATTGEYVTGVVSASGNVTGGNLITAGAISAASVSATGNITGGNIVTSGASGNITGANVISGTTFTATGNVTGGNIVTAAAVSAASVSASGNVTGGNIVSAAAVSGASVVASGNVTGGNIVTAAAVSAASVSASGNVTGGNIVTAAAVSAASVSASGNITGGNANITGTTASTSKTTGALKVAGGVGIAGDLYVGPSLTVDNGAYGNVVTTQFASVFGSGAGPNPYSVMQVRSSDGVSGLGMQAYTGSGTLYGNTAINFALGTIRDKDVPSSLVIKANIDSTGLNVTGIVSASGNVTGGNLITAAAVSAASVSASGNVTGGNLITAAAVSAASVSVSGNVTGGNVNTNTIVGTGTTIISSGAINLSATGNIVVYDRYINNLADPVQNQDAATKNYVDTVAQGLDAKASVHTATTAALPAYTYNNGTSGVGATLTGTATGTLTVAGDTILLGQRVLVKDETGAFVNNTTMSAAFNGIYVCTTEGATGVAYVLTRATDFDIAAEMYSAFVFVETGTGIADTGWVCTNNIANPITVGATQITFTQFSGAGTYTANTSAGLVLNGSVFSAKTDGITTAFDGTGNIIVKASATLTTPDIGAATGTSLSVTGNVTSGNLNAAGLSLSGNVVSAVNTTANITGGNIISLAAFSGVSVVVTGNVSGANINGTTGVYSAGVQVLTINDTVDGGTY